MYLSSKEKEGDTKKELASRDFHNNEGNKFAEWCVWEHENKL